MRRARGPRACVPISDDQTRRAWRQLRRSAADRGSGRGARPGSHGRPSAPRRSHRRARGSSWPDRRTPGSPRGPRRTTRWRSRSTPPSAARPARTRRARAAWASRRAAAPGPASKAPSRHQARYRASTSSRSKARRSARLSARRTANSVGPPLRSPAARPSSTPPERSRQRVMGAADGGTCGADQIGRPPPPTPAVRPGLHVAHVPLLGDLELRRPIQRHEGKSVAITSVSPRCSAAGVTVASRILTTAPAAGPCATEGSPSVRGNVRASDAPSRRWTAW
jgi:hypothetical protein